MGNKREEEPNPLENKEKLSRGGCTCAEFEKLVFIGIEQYKEKYWGMKLKMLGSNKHCKLYEQYGWIQPRAQEIKL